MERFDIRTVQELLGHADVSTSLRPSLALRAPGSLHWMRRVNKASGAA